MGFQTLVPNSTITSLWGNGEVRNQVISVVASVAARDSAITAPVNGMYCTTTDTGWLWRYNGTKWLRQLDTILKTTDTAFVSQTVLQDDPVLQFPVDANSTYWFRFNILWLGPAGPQYAHALKFPSAARIDYSRQSLTTAGAVYQDAGVNLGSGTATIGVGPSGSGNFGSSVFDGILATGATPGSLVFQACQGVSSATGSATQRGSSVTHRQVA